MIAFGLAAGYIKRIWLYIGSITGLIGINSGPKVLMTFSPQ